MESVTISANTLARIPTGLSFVEATPMGYADVTTCDVLHKTNPLPSGRVTSLDISGLDHLGIQFARAMISRPLRSLAALTKRQRLGKWARITTSIPPVTTSPKTCPPWAEE